MVWIPSGLSALLTLWNQSWTLPGVFLTLSSLRSYNPSAFSQGFFSAARMLGSLSVCQNHSSLCSADFPHVLCQCVAVSCIVMYHSASGHAYKMSNLLTQMKTSLVFCTTAAERKSMGIATDSRQTRKCGCCRSLSVFLTRRGKDLKKRRLGADIFLFYMCTELRYKCTVVSTNSVGALCASLCLSLFSFPTLPRVS